MREFLKLDCSTKTFTLALIYIVIKQEESSQVLTFLLFCMVLDSYSSPKKLHLTLHTCVCVSEKTFSSVCLSVFRAGHSNRKNELRNALHEDIISQLVIKIYRTSSIIRPDNTAVNSSSMRSIYICMYIPTYVCEMSPVWNVTNAVQQPPPRPYMVSRWHQEYLWKGTSIACKYLHSDLHIDILSAHTHTCVCT